MAFRRPLKIDGTDLKEMTDTEINNIRTQVQYQYGLNPSTNIQIVSSGGNLGTLTDTRQIAGAHITRADRFATEAELQDPSTISVNYSKVDMQTSTTYNSAANYSTVTINQPADTNNKGFPIYYDGNDIVAMTYADFQDTFIKDAVTTLADGNDRPGTYIVNKSSIKSGSFYPFGSGGEFFIDTGFPSTPTFFSAVDQPGEFDRYYILQNNNISAQSYIAPLQLDGSNDIQQYTTSAFDSLLQAAVRHTTTHTVGYRLRYNFNGSGQQKGTAVTNKVRAHSFGYQTVQFGPDDYRAQQFPNGTVTTANTFTFKVNLE